MRFRTDLDEVLALDQYPAVSVYPPTHPAGREVRQDAIRLRNLRQGGNVTLVDPTQLPPDGPAAAILRY
jgi:hypothetical protein